jgi:hypothetical protein
MYLEIYKELFILQTAAEGWKGELDVCTYIIIYETVNKKFVNIHKECFI